MMPKRELDVTQEVDFEILREDWTRYSLSDKALLRVRIGIVKLLNRGLSEIGIPNFTASSQNLLSAIVPKDLVKKDSVAKPGDVTPDDIKAGTDLDFDLVGKPQWQEYKTADGWIVMVRPEVGKVVKLNFYNDLGEPLYWANVQSTFRVKKA
jgi:hypothetical protein